MTPAAAQQKPSTLQLELARANPSGFPKEEFKTTLTNYLDITQASGAMQRSLQLLFGAVGFLLLIACANVGQSPTARKRHRGPGKWPSGFPSERDEASLSANC